MVHVERKEMLRGGQVEENVTQTVAIVNAKEGACSRRKKLPGRLKKKPNHDAQEIRCV